MSNTQHRLARGCALGNGDGEVLVLRQVPLVVLGVKSTIVQDVAQDLRGRVAGGRGAGLQADGDGHFLDVGGGSLSQNIWLV